MIDFNKYSELVDVLNVWAKEYADGKPSVADDVYDKNYLLLKEFEAANPAFILDNSPTRHVVDGADGFRKVRHEIPMISISNSNGIAEADEWCTRMHHDGVGLFELEYKLDGLGLALKYRDGQLIDAVTRGVDNVGDSVWENALQVQGVKHHLLENWTGEIRGEVVWKYDDFDEYNESLAAAGKKQMANPRNGATGTLKLHDPEEVGKRKLSFVAYLVVQGSPYRTQIEDIEWLNRMGFEIPPHHVVPIERFHEVAESMREARFEQEYAIDGVVIKVNDKSLHAGFGYTAKSPNFYRAYKFPPEEKETELLDIEQSIGMSGAITPVAILKPVSLAMTTVQRCSLHNWDLVEYLGLHKGCHVVVRKAGEIIPEIVACVETGRSKDAFEVLRSQGKVDRFVDSEPLMAGEDVYMRPEVCPYCGNRLHKAVNDAGEALVAWVCDNDDCRVQFLNKLINFGSRSVMAIRGFGESIAEALVECGKVKDFTDLYELVPGDLIGLCGYKQKSAEKLVSAIAASRGNYLHQLIEGFSVPGIGHQASPIMAKAISNAGGLGVVADMTEPSLDALADEVTAAGVPEAAARKMCRWIADNREMCKFFAAEGIAQEVKEQTAVSAKLAGKVCIMTGVFDQLDRDVFKDMVVANGGTICSSITKKCNIVLMGDGAGPSKVKKIEELQKAGQDITVYTTETLNKFLELLK